MDLENNIITLLKQERGIVAIYLFGSRAKGKSTDTSDIDIAVLYEHASIPNLLDLIQLRENLSDQLKHDLDLVCLNTCSPIIGMQIAQHGKRLLITDKHKYNAFMSYLFTEYADLKISRKKTEDRILKRKYYS